MLAVERPLEGRLKAATSADRAAGVRTPAFGSDWEMGQTTYRVRRWVASLAQPTVSPDWDGAVLLVS